MKLYYMPGACSLASHITLIWAGADYELERLSHESIHAPDFLAVNPKGAVPTLTISVSSGQSHHLTESLAVLLHIAAQNPDARLGADARHPIEVAQMNETMSELVSEVHKAFVPTFVPDRYTEDPASYDSVRSAAFKQIEKAFHRLDGRLAGRDWLVLERRTVADAYLHVMSRWLAKTPTPVENFQNLMRHHKTLSIDPGVTRAILEEEDQ